MHFQSSYLIKKTYPFGMAMEGRSYEAGKYKYGFNNQEKDDEIYGEGNSTGAEFWQYDGRLGRRWNVDPVFKEYESPYACFGGSPIWMVDWNGDDWFVNSQGFYIWSMNADIMEKGFSYAGTKLPEGVINYRILTMKETQTNVGKQLILYHKYSTDYFALALKYISGDMSVITLQKYSYHNEAMQEELLWTAIGYGVFKGLGYTFKQFKAIGGSIWKLPSVGTGNVGVAFEKYLVDKKIISNRFISQTFKTFDAFSKGTAWSVKTLNLKMPSYLKPNVVYNKIKGYVDEMVDFTSWEAKGQKLTKEQIENRVLELGIPKGATKAQTAELLKAVEYGKTKNVTINITVLQ